MAKTIKVLIRCEAKSYGDGRSFAFGDVAEIAEQDAKCLLKTGEAVETSLPVTCDSKGNDLPDSRTEAATMAAVKSVTRDGGSLSARRKPVSA